MSTEQNSVQDGKLTDEQLGKLFKKLEEIKKRIEKGGKVSLQDALDVMQYIIIEGKAPGHLNVALHKTHRIIPVEKTWKEDGHFITFQVISDGTTGPEWVELFGEDKLSNCAKNILFSDKFIPTTKIIYTMIIIRGSISKSEELLTKEVSEHALNLNLLTPNLEAMCLFRRKYNNEDIEDFMGLTSVALTPCPINIPKISESRILGINPDTKTKKNEFLLTTFPYYEEGIWDKKSGFMFEISRQSMK